MIAVVEIAGKQIRVAKKEKLAVPLLKDEAGSTVTFDKVLLLQDAKSVKVGNPAVKGAKVEAKVLGNGKGEKVTVFRKKRRKGFKVLRGHRQRFTEIEITSITS